MIKIPEKFFVTEYKEERIPGVDDQSNLELGANCQVFAFELLKVNGVEVPNFRSDELWEDSIFSEKVEIPEPLDLLLYSSNGKSYGAHVGVFIGDGKLIHLSIQNRYAEVTDHESMLKNEKYRYFIGAKRIICGKKT